MAIAVSYPGVYVREEASGARAIGGVATSVASFVGMAEQGPMDTPTRAFSVADFERGFGATTRGELAAQVRQFYLNGGGQAWITRIANGHVRAAVTLRNHADSADAMVVRARDPGILGDQIRVEVDYATNDPDETFNLRAYRSRVLADGTRTRENEETFLALSMRPEAPTYARSAVDGVSQLITVEPRAPGASGGLSLGARILAAAPDEARTELLGVVTVTAHALRLQVAGHPAVPVSLTPAVDAGATIADIATTWQTDLNAALTDASIGASVAVTITDANVAGGGVAGGRLLRIASTDGRVRITAGTSNDVTVALGLGSTTGGIEGSTHGDLRPAATGLVARLGTSANDFESLRTLAGLNRDAITAFQVTDANPESPHGAPLALGGAVPLYDDGGTRSFVNVRAVLDTIAAVIGANTSARWTAARHGVRLALAATDPAANAGAGATFTLAGATIDAAGNVRAYTVGMPGGVGGTGPFQDGAVQGDDGTVPTPQDYADAYAIVDREVPLFNLLLLPRADGQDDDARGALWGAASAFCARKRAFLLVDPRSDWSDVRSAETGVNAIRIGVETRNAACYWPRVMIGDGTRQGRAIDPCGSIAGLMARTDSTRGVWKAPAGLEATIRGVVGLEHRLTDDENGVINPLALNALRVFTAGVVSWGARTLVGFNDSGNVDDKYVPVRRTMLFIEESLYRGLHFAVFEPNDEPLWAQIRLAAGSFMNGLFRQGAFAGSRTSDAYFVACDASTTTASDINLGIVNIVVGFAPLKPAEFVVLTVKQLAGQAEV
jgi:uncharacterized protein